ncbi:putative HMP/thiamine import ATP-binding protein YkoD [Paenibacillus alvei DSM 29]|uniref:ABC transporter ATP-binding protein n=1 Tax=Paenibacillus alvei TaxID=44250 RepID=UPI000289DEB4|nr:putative HMP/thiamine import ATP-binding protein YkoD [Paenibacillus alvei DSM 29]
MSQAKRLHLRVKRWFKALSSKVQRPPAELAFVFQNPEMQFLTDSIYNEMAYESRQERMDENDIARRIEQMLTAFDLNVSHERHPYHLSLGQKRRLSVATAMMRERPVLLLDEPTFGQDAKNTFAMLEKLEQLRSNGTTIIMITHDMHIANSFADRVWQIDDGKLLKMTVPVPILREVQLT